MRYSDIPRLTGFPNPCIIANQPPHLLFRNYDPDLVLQKSFSNHLFLQKVSKMRPTQHNVDLYWCCTNRNYSVKGKHTESVFEVGRGVWRSSYQPLCSGRAT